LNLRLSRNSPPTVTNALNARPIPIAASGKVQFGASPHVDLELGLILFGNQVKA
jgi:hypothetical protein